MTRMDLLVGSIIAAFGIVLFFGLRDVVLWAVR